jgi:hypothetical protein
VSIFTQNNEKKAREKEALLIALGALSVEINVLSKATEYQKREMLEKFGKSFDVFKTEVMTAGAVLIEMIKERT